MSRLFAIPPVSPLRSRIATGLVAVLLALLLVPSAAILAADNDEAKKKAGQPSEEEILLLMRMFSETFEQIERNYVKGIDRRRLVEAAIRGMLKELDQYSNYISPDQISRFQQSVSQQFGGIGIQVRPDLVVATPLAGSPAYKAGIKAGDRIVEIDGKQASTFPENRKLETAVSLMKGKAGDPVTLGIRRTGVKDVIKITVKRAIVQVPTVMGDAFGKDDQWRFMLDDKQKIGYVRLTHFARRTADELSAALGRLKKQGMKALVIDLRFNPGGLLSQATRISDMFIDKGRIVSTKGRNVRERIWDATKPGTHSGFPIAILVNHFSASASEILSACLQASRDRRRKDLGQGERPERDPARRRLQCTETDHRQLPSPQRTQHPSLPQQQADRCLGRDARQGAGSQDVTPRHDPVPGVPEKTRRDPGRRPTQE